MIDDRSPKEIIDQYTNLAPVNVERIVNDFGIKIMYAELGDNVSGAIKKDNLFGGNSGYVILVNQADPKSRQRFTIAHELAHYLLHKEFIGDGIKEDTLYRSTLSNPMEKQANKVAANILMPRQLIKDLMSQYNNNIKNVAKKLQVSLQTLEIQLAS